MPWWRATIGAMITRALILGGLVILLVVGRPVRGHSPPPPPVPDPEGFTAIFDGKSLDGWRAPDMSWWRVEDGAVTGEVTAETAPKENSFLVWQGEPMKDFELKLCFRIFGKEANSGMQFRSEVKDRGLVHGYQADIDGAGKFAAGIWDEYGTRKSLAARGERATWDADGKKTIEKIADPFEGKPADLTQWTEYHITAVGNKITLHVNGKLACELVDADPKKQRLSGVLAVPVIPKPMKVQYKDIRLKRIDSRKAAGDGKPAEAMFTDGELREQWTQAWEKYTAAEEGTPEQEALLAEVRRIAGLRRGKRQDPGPQFTPLSDQPDRVGWIESMVGTSVAFSDDGTRILTAGGQQARVCAAGRLQPLSPPIEHGAGIWAASLSTDGKRLLTAGGRAARVWDAATGKPLAAMEHPAEIRCAAFSPDGRRIVTGGEDGRIRLWNADSGAAIDIRPPEHVQAVRFVAFLPDGKRIVSADIHVKERLGRPEKTPAKGVAIRVWDADSGKVAWESVSPHVWKSWSGVAISRDGGTIAGLVESFRYAVVFDAGSGAERSRVEADGMDAGALSPDGKRLATADWGSVQIWDTATGKPAGKPISAGIRDPVATVAFSPDGKRLLICARSAEFGLESQLAGVWDVETQRKMLRFGRAEVTTGGFSPTGGLVAVGWNGSDATGADIWKVPATVPPAAAPPQMIAGVLPAAGSDDWHENFGIFAKSDLPKDLPLPAKTPFDGDAGLRKAYHRAYLVAFVAGIIDTPFAEDRGDHLYGKDQAYTAGYRAGELAAARLREKREQSRRDARYGYRGPSGHLVTDESPAEELPVRKAFIAFGERFAAGLRSRYPDTLELKVIGVARLYRFSYNTYDHDNSGEPKTRDAYMGVLDSQKAGNFDWLRVQIKDPASAGPLEQELQGRYGFYFDYDAAAPRWSLVKDEFSRHTDGSYQHYQQIDKAGRSFQGKDSTIARRHIFAAIAEAQAPAK